MDSLQIDGASVQSILEQNLDLNRRRQYDEEGHREARGRGQMQAILEGLKRLKDLRLETRKEEGAVHLKLEVRTRAAGWRPRNQAAGEGRRRAR